MKNSITWKYSFITLNPAKSAPALLVLIFFTGACFFWLNPFAAVIFSFFFIWSMREFIFPFKYTFKTGKNPVIIVKHAFLTREYDLDRFVSVKEWKNGLFLSTMYEENRISGIRGLKLFIPPQKSGEIRKVIDETILDRGRRKKNSKKSG